MKKVSLAGLVLAMFGAVSLVFQGSIFGNGFGAISVQIMAGMLMIWARMTLGRRSFHASANPTEGGLIHTGPYRFLRHPIYASILYFIWAGLSSHFSIVSFLLASAVSLGLFTRMWAEERLLAKGIPITKSTQPELKESFHLLFKQNLQNSPSGARPLHGLKFQS